MFWKKKIKSKIRRKRDRVLDLSVNAIFNDASFAEVISCIQEVNIIFERIEYSKQSIIVHYTDFNDCSFFVYTPKLKDEKFKKYIKALIQLDLMDDRNDLNPFFEIQKILNLTEKENDDFQKNFFKSFELIQLKISESMIKKIKKKRDEVD